MKLLYRFFWSIVNEDPETKNIFYELENNDLILKYAINRRLEGITLDFFNRENIFDSSLNNALKLNAKKRVLRSLLIKESALEICNNLSSKNINYVLLKGTNFIDPIYNYFNRNIRDIDLLIDFNEINKAIKIFEELGYSFSKTDTFINKKNKNNFIEYADNKYNYDLPPMRNANGVCVEIHFKIFAKSKTSPCLFGRDLLHKKKAQVLYNKKINFCEENYLILHLIYHGTSKEFFDTGLNFVLDLKKIFKERHIKIDNLIKLAKKYDLYKEAILSLNLLLDIDYINAYLKVNNKYIDKELIKDAKFLLVSKTSKPGLDYIVYHSEENLIKKLYKSLFVSKEIVGREFLISKKNPLIYFYYLKRWARQIFANTMEFFKLATEQDKKLKIKSMKSLRTYLS